MGKLFWMNMANLHELTKQLDVLTWNSRSVLNALIRSVMKAGSSDGFIVTRAGEQVKLTKEDIYRIYHFYEEWESEGYPKGDEFYDLLDKANRCYGDGDLATKSLVAHAKLMWQDSSNKGSDDDYWIGRIVNYENSKWFTNTAPIPLNIRTPIYDENLSTKTYDSYETYLFPSAYYSIDTLGYNGDGNIHTAGGSEWMFDVSRMFRVSSDIVRLGSHDTEYDELVSSLYSDYTPKYALEGGHNSGAFRKFAMSYGDGNFANGDRAVVLGGSSNLALASNDGIIGGVGNEVAVRNGFIGAGINNRIGGGTNGFAANSLNSVGGYSYEFSRMLVSSDKETECEPEYNPPGTDCWYTLSTTTSATETSNALALNQVFISAAEVARSGIGTANLISSSNASAERMPVDFKVGDMVMIFGVRLKSNSNKGCQAQRFTVINIEKHTAKGIVPLSSVDPADGYVISLNYDLTVNKFPDLGSNHIAFGYICRVAANEYPIVATNGTIIRNDTLDCSDGTVLGYNNIVTGHAQTVVGASNRELLRPNFIVGSGSSYIGSRDYHRSNSFVSAPNYTYAMTSQYIVSGVATVTTAYIHGDPDFRLRQQYDEDYLTSGVEKYAGFYAYSKDSRENDATRAVLRVYHEKSVLAIGENGLVLHEPVTDYNNQTKTVWNELYSKHGGISLHSGSFLEHGAQDAGNNWIDFYNNWIRKSSVPGKDNSVTMWAKDNAGIHGDNVILHATKYIRMNCEMLSIRGNTRQALTAQPTDYGVEAYGKAATRIDLIKDSGHFYSNKLTSGLLSDPDIGYAVNNPYVGAYHVLSSSKSVNTGARPYAYEVAQLLLPGNLTSSCNRSLRGTASIPHPIVMSSKVLHDPYNSVSDSNSRDAQDGGNGTVGGYLYEELAYLSDIRTQASVINNVAIPAYTQSQSPSSSRLDTNPLVPGKSWTTMQDAFLASIINNDTSTYHDTNVPVSCSVATPHSGKIVRPMSLSGAANSVTILDPQRTALYLDGVEINPAFRLTTLDGTITKSITYLAFAPTSISNVNNVYTSNLSATVPARSLYTSKYSAGWTSSQVYDLCDVWAIVANPQYSTITEVYWSKLLKNLIITICGGRLTVEFTVVGSTLLEYVLPVVEGTNNSIIEGTGLITIGQYPINLTIPLDPSVAQSLGSAQNLTTGVISQLHGKAYYTGDKNVFATGFVGQNIAPACYDISNPAPQSANTFYGPYITLSIAGFGDFANNHEYYVCVEGVVGNV